MDIHASQHHSPPAEEADAPVRKADEKSFPTLPTSVCKTNRDLLITEIGGKINLYSIKSNPAHPILKGTLDTETPLFHLALLKAGDEQYFACGHPSRPTPVKFCYKVDTKHPVKKLQQARDLLVAIAHSQLHVYQLKVEGGRITIEAAFALSHQNPILDFVVHHESDIVIAGGKNGELVVWNLVTRKHIYRTVNSKLGDVVSISNNAKVYFVGYRNGYVETLSIEKSPVWTVIKIHEWKDEKMMSDPLTCVRGNDSTLLFVGRESGKLSVVDTSNFTIKFTFAAHKKQVSSVTISAGHLYSTGYDQCLSVWAPSKSPATASVGSRFSTETHKSGNNISLALVEAVETGLNNPGTLSPFASDILRALAHTIDLEVRIDPYVRELDATGKVIYHAEAYGLIGSISSVELMKYNAPDYANPSTRAQTANMVLELLQFSFQKDPQHSEGTFFHPSHQWVTNDKRVAFINCLPRLCELAAEALSNDKMLVRVQSPAYILGDIHGSYKDLDFFATALWNLGVDFTPSKYVFLGDYVDRGPHSVEVIAYVLAMKVLYPTQVFLLRGNHEFEDQNGKDYNYSFRTMCHKLFADEPNPSGEALWNTFNGCFDWMPLAAVVDEKIFCCHGGIPRLIDSQTDIFNQIESIKRPLKIYDVQIDPSCLSLDLLWSDPAPPEKEESLTGGFGPNPARGDNILVFGTTAFEKFKELTGCTHLIRAHQPPRLGVLVQKKCRVLTVFSSSHYCGSYNSAAVVFVHNNSIQVAVTSHRSAGPETEKKTFG